MPAGLDAFARPAGKPGFGQCRAQWLAGVATRYPFDLVVTEHADIRAATEIASVMAFFVGPGGDLDAETGAIGVGGQSTASSRP